MVDERARNRDALLLAAGELVGERVHLVCEADHALVGLAQARLAHRGEIRRQVPEILRLVGLSTKLHSYPDELSGGEQQRVSIARAFVNHPPLLLADEPSGNLDPVTSIGVMQLLYRINKTGTTVVVVTHDREMVDNMAARRIHRSCSAP